MSQTLQYAVPAGVDYAVVVAELAKTGYETHVEEVAGQWVVTIDQPDGADPDRERVRDLLAATPSAIDAGVPTSPVVVFEDERG